MRLRNLLSALLCFSLCLLCANFAKAGAVPTVGLTFDENGNLMLQRTGESDVYLQAVNTYNTVVGYDSMGTTLEYQLDSGPYMFTAGSAPGASFGSSDWIIQNSTGGIQDLIIFTNAPDVSGGTNNNDGGDQDVATIFVYQPTPPAAAPGDLAKPINTGSPKYASTGATVPSGSTLGGSAAQILAQELALQNTRLPLNSSTLSDYFTQALLTDGSGNFDAETYTLNEGANVNGTQDTIATESSDPSDPNTVSAGYGSQGFYNGGTNNSSGFATSPTLKTTTTGEIYSYSTGETTDPGFTKYTGINNTETIVTFVAAVPLPNTAGTMALLLSLVSLAYWRSAKRRSTLIA